MYPFAQGFECLRPACLQMGSHTYTVCQPGNVECRVYWDTELLHLSLLQGDPGEDGKSVRQFILLMCLSVPILVSVCVCVIV